MQTIRQMKHVALLALLVLALLALPSARAASPGSMRGDDFGFVKSSHVLADDIGRQVLKDGGNAIDAAVAVGYALAVVHPAAGNIGGGGFAVIHLQDGTNTACDFREKAPLAATRDMYLDAQGDVVPGLSTDTYLAAGVPGTVAGMSAMLERYGTKKLEELMTPAIFLATYGYYINHRQEDSLGRFYDKMKQFASTRKYFIKPDGQPYVAGELFVQKDLGATLRRIAKNGPDEFYKGETARLIVQDMQANQGIITMEDLARYRVAWRHPVKATYRGYDIISMSPPSSGGAHIAQILNVMENADVGAMGFGSSASIHLMAEAMRYAYADRSEYMGDTDFVDVPLHKLTSKAYAKQIFDRIQANKDRATPSKEIKPGMLFNEGNNTTHYSVVDSFGNAVAVTYTINDSYGSRAAVNGAGFLLNNEMDDFSAKAGVPNIYGLVGTDANAIQPEKRPLSSMSPTIVLKDGKVFMVVGSPGGSRIITTTLQTIVNVIDHGMTISEAVHAPRIHMQWLPDELRVEKYGVVKDVENRLKEMGYEVVVRDPMGDVNAILVNPVTGAVTGSGDPRAEF